MAPTAKQDKSEPAADVTKDEAGQPPEDTSAEDAGAPADDGVKDEPDLGPRSANAGVGDDVVTVSAGEELNAATYKEFTGGDRLVELTSDVVETFYFPNTVRPSTRLLYRKGQIVRLSDIEGRTSA